jgi:SAM-dependent methyltransferase
VFLNPAPTQAFLDDAYDDSYYSYQELAVAPRWKEWLRTGIFYNPGATGDPKFDAPGRVLDIGCGSGEFLYKMKKAGWETHGVELSAKAASIGNAAGLDIQAGTLASARLPQDYFDYVRLNHSFEHLVDPEETLALIWRYLARDGLLFIGVPNVDGWLAKVFGKYWWNLGPPVHPFNYSRSSLTRLLEKHRFSVVRSRTNSNFAGLVGSLQMMINDKNGIRSDRGRLLGNPLVKVPAQWCAKISDRFSAGDCLEIIARKRIA